MFVSICSLTGFESGSKVVDFLCGLKGYNCDMESKGDSLGHYLYRRSVKYYENYETGFFYLKYHI